MAYSTDVIDSLDDIIPLAAAFATANGWTVDSTTPTAPIFTMPTSWTPINFQMTYVSSGTDRILRLTANGSGVTTDSAQIISPKLSPPSGTTPIIPDPVRVHFFGSTGATDIPYIAIVVEYGPNSFRHLYMGCLEKLGDYTGGEVISGTGMPSTAYNANVAYTNGAYVRYLFDGRATYGSSGFRGGAHIAHADNPDPWRRFTGYDAGFINDVPNNSILGGFGNGVNDGYLARAEAPFAGVNALVPINLYNVKPVTGSKNFIPVGRPPGIRTVHMKNLDPKQIIEVGGVNYHVFPVASKEVTGTMTRTTANGNWRNFESTYYIGYAYPES